MASKLDQFIAEVTENANWAWLGLGDVTKVRTKSPFDNPALARLPVQDKLLHLVRDPAYLAWTAKTFLGFECHPYQSVILGQLWTHAFPLLMATRGGAKTTTFGVYALLRALLDQGSKVLIVGAAFRQAKAVFETCANLWYNSPMLQSLVGGTTRQGPRFEVDQCYMGVGESSITAIPLGNGEKIRGKRASHLIIDEFKSVPIAVIENVVLGFAAVSASPLEKVKQEYYRQYLRDRGLWLPAMDEDEEGKLASNQTVIGGTAYFAFNHFYDYWQKWKKFIQSKGDPVRYERLLGTPMPKNFNPRDFCVIRLAATMLPRKFMDEKTLARAEATVSKSNYLMEYGACPVTDSDGFFRRSLVESCVVGRPGAPIAHPSCGDAFYKAAMKGRAGCRYVIGIDPASQRDNFAVVVLEVWPDHRRVVYCWTSRQKEYTAAKRKGLTTETTFYAYCARKIRTLMRVFRPCDRVGMDTQGGGHQVAEALNDTQKMNPGEALILPTIVKDDKKDTDLMVGDHCLVLVNFASAQWTSEANHGLKKDLEDKVLLFPFFDPAEIEIALERDKEAGLVEVDEKTGESLKLTDTLGDNYDNIEDLKNELALIQHTATGAGRERWDLPDTHGEQGEQVGRLRKDRYSALLIANAAAREMMLHPEAPPVVLPMGGFARDMARGGAGDGELYQWPAHVAAAMAGARLGRVGG